jgi:hypothetical protein
MLQTVSFYGSAAWPRRADDLTMPAEWVEERLSPVFERPVERTIAGLSIEPHSEGATG